MGRGQNLIFLLADGQSVFDDGAADQLIGSAGQDWFWPGPGDALDLQPGEAVK